MKKAIKTCAFESCEAIAEHVYCATHAALMRKAERQGVKDAEKHQKKMELAKKGKTSINPISPKQLERMRQYSKDRALWLPGKKCAVFPEKNAVECHHRKGREGYADTWARDNGVWLLNDQRFWLAVSHEGHLKITNNSAWAEEQGFTIKRSKDEEALQDS